MHAKLKIGNVVLDNNVILAPMAGVSNQAFREIAKDFNVGLVCAEMISDQALNFKNEKTLAMTKVSKDEHPISMQLFGSDVESLRKAAIFLDQESDCYIIDFNMGCPAPKIVNNGAGSALMKDLDLAYEIVSAMVESVNKPVTVKFRAGYDLTSINAVECAIRMEAAGAAALTVHGRTRSQMYSGQCDLDIIKAVKAAVSIPVIGNGDIRSYADAKIMLDETNCDGIMIGRAAFGNPWVLKEVVDGLAGKDHKQVRSFDQIYYYIKKQYAALIDLKGEAIATKEIRSHVSWYLAGLPLNKRVKEVINKQDDKTILLDLLEKYFSIITKEDYDLVSIENLCNEF